MDERGGLMEPVPTLRENVCILSAPPVSGTALDALRPVPESFLTSPALLSYSVELGALLCAAGVSG